MVIMIGKSKFLVVRQRKMKSKQHHSLKSKLKIWLHFCNQKKKFWFLFVVNLGNQFYTHKKQNSLCFFLIYF